MASGTIHMLNGSPDFTIDSDQISGQGGANGPSITIPIKLDFSGMGAFRKVAPSKIEVLSVKGELRTRDGGIKCAEAYKIVSRSISYNSPYQEYLNFSLSNEIVSKIEKHRNVKVYFILDIFIQTAFYEEVKMANNESRSFMTGTETSSGTIQFEIDQSHWINSILPQLGHDSYRLIELPATSQLIPKEYNASFVELEAARKYFLNGDYDKTVAHCRSALDPFKPIKGEIKKYVSSKSEFAWAEDVMEATNEWLLKLVRSTSHFTSKAHHIPSVGHFDRMEAEIIMMVTIAILAYIGKVKVE